MRHTPSGVCEVDCIVSSFIHIGSLFADKAQSISTNADKSLNIRWC